MTERRGPGRPSKLTQRHERGGIVRTVGDWIIADVADGLPLDLAIRRSPAANRSIYDWFSTASKADERLRIHPHTKVTRHEQECRQFSHRVEAARTEAQATWLGYLDRLAAGGQVTKVVQKIDPTTGTVLERQVTQEQYLPSFAAVRWRLEQSGLHATTKVDVEVNAGSAENREPALVELFEAYAQGAAEAVDVNGYELNSVNVNDESSGNGSGNGST